ncbi:MAG: patatin-like phospholipase family protein [Cytophagales bacterium]|nr:patatin-like phospholipase family protein [Cytophagales bacterium]
MRRALVLSGGGSFGFAQMGALKAFEENDIRFQAVSGCSAGALVGLFYAGGFRPEETLEITKAININRIIKFAWSRKGLFSLKHAERVLRDYFPMDSFTALEKTLIVNATDLSSGQTRFFHTRGPMIRPVLASCAIPLLFKPVPIHGALYYDGGISNNFPVAGLQDHYDEIIGINVLHINKRFHFNETNLKGLMHRVASIIAQSNSAKDFCQCDYLLEPKGLESYSPLDTSAACELFQLGYHAGISFLKENNL